MLLNLGNNLLKCSLKFLQRTTSILTKSSQIWIISMQISCKYSLFFMILIKNVVNFLLSFIRYTFYSNKSNYRSLFARQNKIYFWINACPRKSFGGLPDFPSFFCLFDFHINFANSWDSLGILGHDFLPLFSTIWKVIHSAIKLYVYCW